MRFGGGIRLAGFFDSALSLAAALESGGLRFSTVGQYQTTALNQKATDNCSTTVASDNRSFCGVACRNGQPLCMTKLSVIGQPLFESNVDPQNGQPL